MNAIDTIPHTAPGALPTPRRHFGSLLGGLILVELGGLWILDLAGVIELQLAIVLPSVLIVIGLALVIGANDGPHSGLVVAGLFMAIAVVLAAALPITALSGGIGERRFHVIEQASLAPNYQVGIGNVQLDLRDLKMDESAVV